MKLVVYVVGLERAHPLAHDDPAPPVRQRLNQEEKTCFVLVYFSFTQVCIKDINDHFTCTHLKQCQCSTTNILCKYNTVLTYL